MGIFLDVVRIAAVVYGIVALFAVMFADRILFQPQPASYRKNPDIITLTAADGVHISAIHLRNPHARYTILFSHGNGEDLGDILPLLREFQERGYAVFAYDYRGYGTSEGRPSEKGANRDIEAAYLYLTHQLHVPAARIIVHGYSVGGGPSVELASRDPVGGLVLESCFTTAFRTVTYLPLLPFDRFRNIGKIGSIRVPVLVIHGTNDRVIPFSHGQRLFEAAAGPKRSLWVDGAGHYDLRERAGEGYWEAYRDFSQMAGASP